MSRTVAGKALVALVIATGCLAAVAYAASMPGPGGVAPPAPGAVGVGPRMAASSLGAAPSSPGAAPPPRPRIVRHPARTTLSTSVGFRYVSRAGVGFLCKLDDAGWKRCGSGVAYRGLAVGTHRFLVRAEAGGGARSRPVRFDWAQAQPESFSIAAELSGLSRLYPGAGPVSLPLTLTNPNSALIFVTGLRVSVAQDPAVCPSAENLELIQANASEKMPVEIPAGASVRLPANGVSPPAIALRDLPVDQDSCQGSQFPLAFSGEAHG